MFNIPFKSGGGVFVSEGMVGEQLPSGQTGPLISLPEVTGKAYKITQISTGATNGIQGGISLTTNGNVLHDQAGLDDLDPSATKPSDSNTFLVSRIFGQSTLTNSKVYDEIICTSFSLSKNAGNTDKAIDLVYEIGSIK